MATFGANLQTPGLVNRNLPSALAPNIPLAGRLAAINALGQVALPALAPILGTAIQGALARIFPSPLNATLNLADVSNGGTVLLQWDGVGAVPAPGDIAFLSETTRGRVATIAGLTPQEESRGLILGVFAAAAPAGVAGDLVAVNLAVQGDTPADLADPSLYPPNLGFSEAAEAFLSGAGGGAVAAGTIVHVVVAPTITPGGLASQSWRALPFLEEVAGLSNDIVFVGIHPTAGFIIAGNATPSLHLLFQNRTGGAPAVNALTVTVRWAFVRVS
jgi:hypothetical protein